MFRKIFHPALFLCLVVSFLSLNFVNAQSADQPMQVVKYQKFRISIDGGLGYLIASTGTAKEQMRNYGIPDQEADRYYRELKLGEQAGGSVHYMINQTMGLGFDYNLFTTGSSVMGYLDTGDGWTKYYGPFNEKIYTSFVGVSAFQSQKLSERWDLYGKFSVGMVFYRNEARIIVAPAMITGNAPAIRGESGISYSLTRHVSVNAGLSYLFSSLRKIELSNGANTSEVELEGDMKENLSRLSLSTGVQFHF